MKKSLRLDENLGGKRDASLRPGGLVPMQFLIERQCPVVDGQVPVEKVAPLLPMVIWVDLSREPRCTDNCGAKRYLVPTEQAASIRKKLGLKTSSDRSVCEHMGRLIE